MVRKLRVSDEQINLLVKGLFKIPVEGLTPAQNYEIGSLAGMLDKITKCKDSSIEHGLVL